MKTIRTPDHRFEELTEYNFSPRYMEVEDGLRLHYVDEGDPDGPPMLLLHGEPSWSYLYRKMIPLLATNGFRVIAPDLIGFGRSDKPVEQSDYTYQHHINWLAAFIENLDLRDITLFCQDWGGLIGLRLVALMENRFSMIVASNTFLPTGDPPLPEVFFKWRAFSQNSPDFDIGTVIDMGTVRKLSEEVIAAYNAPFPSEEYKAGARIFPMLVPTGPDDPEAVSNREAWQVLMRWEKPFLTIFGEQDYIMKGADKVFQKIIPGARSQDHATLDAGHFIQEEKGPELAELLIAFYKRNTAAG